MATPRIKQEPNASTSAGAFDGARIKQENADYFVKNEATSDDEYEDAGDLDFENGTRGVWLVKLPKFLMENWEKIDDDEEITLGHIWVKNDAKTSKVLR